MVGVLTVDRLLDAQPYAPFDHDLRFLAMVANLLGQTCACTSSSTRTESA